MAGFDLSSGFLFARWRRDLFHRCRGRSGVFWDLSVGVKKLHRRLGFRDRKSTRLNSSHTVTSYAVFGLKKKLHQVQEPRRDLLPTPDPIVPGERATVQPELTPPANTLVNSYGHSVPRSGPRRMQERRPA